MRLLVVADLHYSLPQYDWLLGVAADYDLVVIAGDHMDLSSLVDWQAQCVVIRKYIERLKAKTRLITCSGNHDLDARDPSGERIALWMKELDREGVPADGASLVLDGTLITICPWWDGPLVREGIGRLLAADAEKDKKRWMWIHHAPPDASPTSWGGSRYFGDRELVGWIKQYRPDIVFSGHVHQSPFVKDGSWVDRIGDTWVFNAGHQFGAPPAHIVVDTAEESALWMSAAGNQCVRLTEPLARPLARLQELPAWFTAADRTRLPAPAGIPGSGGG